MAEITVKDDHAPLTARVRFLDAEGHETSADQAPTWSSTDESVATVTASEDGMSATVEIGAPGATVIEAKGMETGDGSGDPVEIVAQGTVTVQPGDAVIGEVSFDETA